MKKIIIVVAILIVAVAWFLVDQTREVQDTRNTYSNQQLGFAVDYPTAWRSEECVSEGFGFIGFGDTTEKMLICDSDATPLSYVNISVGQLENIEDAITQTQEALADSSRSETTIGGQSASIVRGTTVQMEGPSLPAGVKETIAFVKHGDRVYVITHWNLENKDYTNEYDDMLDSFRFL